ncbi:MAG: hypothetical protein OXU61_12255 [Gammaproteobacteria bacterium]|nr:hypothetical protein [Gammaproteobacteria bacterium]
MTIPCWESWYRWSAFERRIRALRFSGGAGALLPPAVGRRGRRNGAGGQGNSLRAAYSRLLRRRAGEQRF